MHWQVLILVLGLFAALEVAGGADWDEMTPCQELQQEWKNGGAETPYSEEALGMALLWDGELGHAGAALLRATLLASGYRADFIRLYNRYSDVHPPADSDLLTIDVTMAARLQVRLTARAARSSTCKNDSIWSFPKDMDTFRNCDFLTLGTENSTYANVYIINKWNNTCAAELIRETIANYSFIRLVYVDQTNLIDQIQNSNNSFFFLDTDLYNRTNAIKYVHDAKVPLSYTECFSSLDDIVSLKYANNLLSEKFIVFSPTLDDLYHVLQTYQSNDDMNIENAACKWALQDDTRFKKWRESALSKPRRGLVLLMICQSETPDTYEKLRDMTTLIEDYSNDTLLTYLDKKSINIKVAYYDCPNIGLLLKTSIIMFQENRIPNLEGIIMPENLAVALAPYAALLQVPLLTYDVNSGSMVESAVRSATGNVNHLELALRRLLADCGWQRLAIISEPTHLAKALSAALRAPTALLTIIEVNVTSSSDIRGALQKLLVDKARVFLVNTAAPMAARILAEAQSLNITRDKGFGWIVREYDMADNATIVTRPYSVSFWWRGNSKDDTRSKNDKVDKINDRMVNGNDMKYNVALREKLEEKWHGHAWPLHAAPILDALLTLTRGINLFKDNITGTWPRAKKNMTTIWNYIQDRSIPGIYETLTYDKEGIITPSVFVEQWGSEPRPRLLATWRGGEWRQTADKCPAIDPPHDGSTFCLISSGDPFQPTCWDIIWVPSSVLVILVGTVFIIIAIYFTRKILKSHDLRIKTEYAKRLLARRERVFEALGASLVERSALKLLQELGTGRFGRVHLGLLREPGSKLQNVVVAAKALKEEASSAEESEFLKEACTLATLHHDHIISFLGVCVVDGPPLLLMEHAFFGDLLHYLQARRYLAEGPADADSNPSWFQKNEKAHVSAKSLTKLAQEAALALAYLAQRGIVHRDLRASNCLVDERRCLKLADFGLARATGTIDGEYACRRGFFPVLWMAPESLGKGVSSAASDVWSFGVLVYELVTLGRRPYGAQPPSTVMRHVLAGGRPWLPWDASKETRALTRACWRREPEARPTAARLADWLGTQWRALRPALVTELIDIDSNIFSKKNSIDIDSLGSKNSSNESLTVQQSSEIPIKLPDNELNK